MICTALHRAAAGCPYAGTAYSPLAVLNNNGFTRKLQVQACYRQLPPPPLRLELAAGATGAEDQIPKKSTSLFVWHCNIRVSAGFGSEPAVFGLWLGLDGPFSAG